MFIYIGGIPGVGKTTIVRMTIKLAQKSNFFLQGLDEKELLCQITEAKSAEDYSKLPKKIRAQARKQMMEYFYEIDKQDPATIRIRDDHFTAPNKGNSYWVRPLEARDKFHMLAFVVIVADPNSILQRRRERKFLLSEPKFFEFNEVVQHQKIEVETASLQAKLLNIPFRIIENKDGKIEDIEDVSEFLLSFIKAVTKGG